MKLIAALMVLLYLAPAIAEDKKPEIRIRDLEHRVHVLINEARKANSRDPLQLDEKLSSVARAHSVDMGKRGYFDHADPDGKSSKQRVELAGISCNVIGENIFQNNLYTGVTIEKDRK